MRTGLVLAIVIAALASSPVAHAATVIGQSPEPGLAPVACDPNFALFNTSVASGPGYRVPSAGVITSWRTFGTANDIGDSLAMQLFVSQGQTLFTTGYDSGQKTLAAGVNEFPAQVIVSGGEYLGVATGGATKSDCANQTNDPGDNHRFKTPTPAVGATQSFGTIDGYRIDISAVLEADADRDGFGDESQDQCPTEANNQGPCADKCPTEAGVQDKCAADTSAPSVDLTKTPKKKSESRTATFKFASDESGVSFQCAIDKKPLKSCTSPKKFRKLKFRKHKFKLVATDAAGNASEQTTFRWRVVD